MTWPLVGSTNLVNIFSIVDFPEPDAPSKEMISPWFSVKLIFFSTSSSPYLV